MMNQIRILFAAIFLFSVSAFTQNSIELQFPDAILSGIETEIDILNANDSFPAQLIIHDKAVEVFKEEGRAYFVHSFTSGEKLTISGMEIKGHQPNVIPLWMSVLPPLIAILLALIFKEVIFSMVSGVFIGGAIMGFYAEGFVGIFTGFLKVIDTYITISSCSLLFSYYPDIVSRVKHTSVSHSKLNLVGAFFGCPDKSFFVTQHDLSIFFIYYLTCHIN